MTTSTAHDHCDEGKNTTQLIRPGMRIKRGLCLIDRRRGGPLDPRPPRRCRWQHQPHLYSILPPGCYSKRLGFSLQEMVWLAGAGSTSHNCITATTVEAADPRRKGAAVPGKGGAARRGAAAGGGPSRIPAAAEADRSGCAGRRGGERRLRWGGVGEWEGGRPWRKDDDA